METTRLKTTDIAAQKKRIIFLNNLIWKPEHPNFGYKYELLSQHYRGEMFHFSYGYAQKKAGDFTFLSLPQSKGPLRYLRYLLFVLKHVLKDRKVDYIVSYDPFIFCTIAIVLRLLTGAKVIAEVNVNNFEAVAITSKKTYLRKIKKLAIHLLTSFAIKKANGVKFISNDIFQYYNKRFTFNTNVTFFSYISTHVFNINRCTDNNYILLVGHPYKLKGADILIKAFKRISSDFPQVRLKIIGQCDDKSEFEALAKGNSNIQFQQGTEYDQIISEFEGCKLLVAPSRTEAMSRVLIEAMACGKPVIGSRVGGIPEVITENKSGLLFESENDAELAGKIRLLLTDKQLAAELGKNAADDVRNRFAPDRYVELYHEFLQGLD